MLDRNRDAIPKELVEYFARVRKAALAFSGGVDSSYLLYAAQKCGVDLGVYCVASQFQPQFELRDVDRLGRELKAKVKMIPVDILSNYKVANNPPDRCYYCKQSIFKTIQEAAIADGYTLLMDGSNASDDSGDRPGMKVLEEMKVLSPLREVGLTKDRIRELSKKAKLFTWDKAAYACLATRIPTGTKIEAEVLKKIEKAEDDLTKMGFTDFRARVVDQGVKLQFPEEQILKAVQLREEILQRFTPLFDNILLDLKPR